MDTSDSIDTGDTSDSRDPVCSTHFCKESLGSPKRMNFRRIAEGRGGGAFAFQLYCKFFCIEASMFCQQSATFFPKKRAGGRGECQGPFGNSLKISMFWWCQAFLNVEVVLSKSEPCGATTACVFTYALNTAQVHNEPWRNLLCFHCLSRSSQLHWWSQFFLAAMVLWNLDCFEI